MASSSDLERAAKKGKRRADGTEVAKMISIVSHGHLLSALNSIDIPSDAIPNKRRATKSCKRVVYSSDSSMEATGDEEYDPKRASKDPPTSQPHISIDVARENLKVFFTNKDTEEIQETPIPASPTATHSLGVDGSRELERRLTRRKIRAEERNSEGPIKVETKDGRPVGPHKERYVQRIGYLVKSRLDLWSPSILKCPSVQIDSIKSALQATFDCDVSEKYLKDKLGKTFRALKKKVLDNMAKDESQGKEPTRPDWLSEEKWMKMKNLKNSTEFKILQERNKINRSKQKNITNVGRQGYVGLRDEMEKNLGRPPTRNEVFVEAHTFKCKDSAKKGKLNCYAENFARRLQEGEGTSNSTPNYFGSVSRGRVPGCGLGMPTSLKSNSKIEKERYSDEKFQERVQIEVSNVLTKILAGNNLVATNFLQKIREATDVQPQENVQCQARQVSSIVSSSPCAKVANDASHKDVVAHDIERNELPLECDIGHASTNIQEKDFSVLQMRKTKKKDCRRMQQENIIMESKRSLPTSKAKKQIILSEGCPIEGLQLGDKVTVLNIKKKKIAIGTLLSKDPTYRWHCQQVGEKYYVVMVEQIFEPKEQLLLCNEECYLIGHCSGLPLPWPKNLLVKYSM